MEQKALNEAIIEELEHEIAVDIEDYNLLKKRVALDKANGDEINAAYHKGMEASTGANICAVRDMLTVIKCYMNDEPVPDLLQRYPAE